MSNGTNQAIMYLGGAVAIAGIGYYLHTTGFFTSVFKAINDALDKIKETKPLEEDKDKEEEEEKKESKLTMRLALVGNTPYMSPASFKAYKIYQRRHRRF